MRLGEEEEDWRDDEPFACSRSHTFKTPLVDPAAMNSSLESKATLLTALA